MENPVWPDRAVDCAVYSFVDIGVYKMTINEMLEEVVGYAPHFNRIDMEIVSEGKMSCGHNGQYRGFKNGDSYRAFAVCEKCDIAEEF